ncbi:MAG TPA: malectin domain-containing carbohydrate-binding protein [Pirellulaceae bacterium]|nr:malectin domain-containing carbohydrate-binding protein [Pirellulaceae bacterium]
MVRGAFSGFFRNGFTGYYDLYSDSGVSHFAGQRMGCWVNAIPGNGLLMIPEASAGCVYQFSIEATVEYTFDINPTLASGGGYYNYNSEAVQIENANTPWVLSSGARRLTRCELTLLGENDKPATYAVKLHFAQIEECGPGEAMFDIKLPGDTVAEKVDVVREAGATSRAIVRTFNNIAVDKNLVLELVSQGETLPTISAIEVMRK